MWFGALDEGRVGYDGGGIEALGHGEYGVVVGDGGVFFVAVVLTVLSLVAIAGV
jgi:hypothetical protein